jgi:hypothetical protein
VTLSLAKPDLRWIYNERDKNEVAYGVMSITIDKIAQLINI